MFELLFFSPFVKLFELPGRAGRFSCNSQLRPKGG